LPSSLAEFPRGGVVRVGDMLFEPVADVEPIILVKTTGSITAVNAAMGMKPSVRSITLELFEYISLLPTDP